MGAGGRRSKVVFVVGAAAAERERVAAAVRPTADAMRQCVIVNEIDAALIAESAAVIVLAPDQVPTPLLVSAIRQYRVEDPSTAMLLCVQPGTRSVHQLATLARAGLDDLLAVGDLHSPDQLRAAVSRRLRHALPVELVRRVSPVVCDTPRTICAYCFRNGFHRLRVPQVADCWCRDPRTLNRYLQHAGLRSLEHIIDYARLLHAAYRIDDMRAEFAVLARLLDYPSSTAFANYVRRLTGRSPSALQARGAVDTIVQLIKRRIGDPATR